LHTLGPRCESAAVVVIVLRLRAERSATADRASEDGVRRRHGRLDPVETHQDQRTDHAQRAANEDRDERGAPAPSGVRCRLPCLGRCGARVTPAPTKQERNRQSLNRSCEQSGGELSPKSPSTGSPDLPPPSDVENGLLVSKQRRSRMASEKCGLGRSRPSG